jgi:hypothetical protein
MDNNQIYAQYPGVNDVLQRLLADVQVVLGNYFTGMVVHGSLCMGDFEPLRSDVDFLIITTRELPSEMLPILKAMHTQITVSGLEWATQLEGSYIPQDAIRRYNPPHNQHPALRVDGSFDVDEHGSDWIIQRHIIREKGIVLAGPDPHTLIDPIQPDDLRRAALAILQEWWSPQISNPHRLISSEYQAYATLTMCRILYTLQTGCVTTKPGAARWVQKTMGLPWISLIEQALTWRHGMPLDRLNETLDLIRYTLQSHH